MRIPQLLFLLAVLAGSTAISRAERVRPAPTGSTGAPGDRVYYQDTVVVTAAKRSLRLADLATAATVISPAEMRLGTARGLQDVLAPVPGAHLMDLSGSETGGAVEARGFAAQGTSSHVQVLVDEIPINNFETGKVDWNLLAPSQVDHVEFLRGPASFLYGNASMAGLVNLVTRRAGERFSAWAQVEGGDMGRAGGGGGASWSESRVQAALSGVYRRLDGFRDHSARNETSGYGFARVFLGPRWNLGGRLLAHRGEQEIPGPLPDPEWKTSPRQTLTPTDHNDDQVLDAALELRGDLTSELELVALASGDARHVDATETIIPVGALDRESRLRDGRSELRLHWRPHQSSVPDLLVGVEVRGGTLESRYFDPNAGRALVGAGDVRRTGGGVFALARAPLASVLTLSAGARADWLRSSLDDPTDTAPRGSSDDLRAVSPTAGISLTIPRGGYAWLSYSGSFKAPELDQLYDRRPFDLGAGPQYISSNVLRPQQGDHWDAGAHTNLAGGVWFDGALYYVRSRDEIGFDLAHFKLANIERSKHLGFDGQLSVEPVRGVSGSLSYAWTRATFDGGSHDGKQINTVPEHNLFARLSWRHRWEGALTLEVTHTARQWIDENQGYPLPDYTVVNMGATQAVRAAELFATIRNLADERYATLGYVTLSASGTDLPLYFPAMGRSIAVGVRLLPGATGSRARGGP